MNKKSSIYGNFLFCGLPTYENNEHTGFIGSYIRLDEIKAIHRISSTQCTVCTYKDTAYACNMDAKDLVSELNSILYPLKKGNSHGSETPNGFDTQTDNIINTASDKA